MDKILEIINKTEVLQDFIKAEFSKGKISQDTANEQLRLTTEIIEIGLK